MVAKDLATPGITANAICPGVLYTEFWQKLAQHLADTNLAFKGMTARQVFGRRDDEQDPSASLPPCSSLRRRRPTPRSSLVGASHLGPSHRSCERARCRRKEREVER